MTNDHASLSRRRTIPTPHQDTSNSWALIVDVSIPGSLHDVEKNLSAFCLAACGDHLSSRIAIVFSIYTNTRFLVTLIGGGILTPLEPQSRLGDKLLEI